uniref:hypothetical protein n=1 Tax=Brevibacillus daliensis TaxID=2892995 RepID=UPI001E4595D8|nr:hypothetical protein [Brevibacillus daliensis]
MAAATAKDFRGKVVDLAEYSHCHRTTIGHFLAEGKWDEAVLQNKIKAESVRHVLGESKRMSEPLFVIHDDDTICEKSKFSSQATSPIEQTGFHHSHLKGKVVWGHQVQATILQCRDMSLIYSIDLYDKTNTSADGKV